MINVPTRQEIIDRATPELGKLTTDRLREFARLVNVDGYEALDRDGLVAALAEKHAFHVARAAARRAYA